MKNKVICKVFLSSSLFIVLGLSTAMAQAIRKAPTNTTNTLVGIKSANVYSAFNNAFSSLHFNGSPATQGEFATEAVAPSKNQYIVINQTNKSSKNWTRTLLWERIPRTTKYGRYEISLLPFPAGYDPQFSGLIRSGIIAAEGNSTQTFALTYNDGDAAYVAPSKVKIKPVKSATNTVSLPSAGTRPMKIGQTNSANETTIAINTAKLRNGLGLNLLGNETRKFYIRIIPFDTADKPLLAISNDITLEETTTPITEPWKQTTANYVANDYTITAITYVPVHFDEAGFAGCTIVTGYNENGMMPENLKADMKAAFPIGRVICPEPPQDKAWYEKAFNSIAGFVAKSVDGAASFYNETKTFVKNTAMNSLCSNAPQGTEGGCQIAAGAAFEYGMACVGIPPSLPNIDDLSLMAEGQIADLVCDKVASESDFPIPDAAREKLKSELHNNLTAATAKGTMNEGYLSLKPHPRGQFQTAYLRIEVTRTGNANKGKERATFSVADKTSGTTKTYNKQTRTSETVSLSGNLFESTSTTVPYLENVGDKTTVFVVLKPQESYVHFNPTTSAIKSIGHDLPGDSSQSYPMPTYEGYAHTLGFQLLKKEGFTTQFAFGLKVAPGVTSSYANTDN